MLKKLSKSNNDILAVVEAKETDVSGFLANKKIYYIIKKEIKIYELVYDDEYDFELYQLINIEKKISEYKIINLKDDEICCNCFKNIKDESLNNNMFDELYIKVACYFVCIDCASEYIYKVNTFLNSFKKIKTEV